MSVARIGALLGCVALLAACSGESAPVRQVVEVPEPVVTTYDASLEPSAAVLSLVPDAATSLVVTDFDLLRLVEGFATLDGDSPEAESAEFWQRLPTTASLSTGLLRPADRRLRNQFGISQDDVAWEATWSDGAGAAGGTGGWVLAFHDDVAMADVGRAVEAGVGPLQGAVVDTDRQLVTSGAALDVEESWGADPTIVDVAGREAVSTYVERGCVPLDTVFGAGVSDQLADAPAAAVAALDELDVFAVALGDELATVLLGEDRSDAFDRMRLAEILPRTNPELAAVMDRGVADPSTGRIGYTLKDPGGAADLTLARTLPFAVCPG